MNKNFEVLLPNLPGPPYQRLCRNTAGGFGTAFPRSSKYKRNGEAPLHPFLPYASSLLLEAGYEFKRASFNEEERKTLKIEAKKFATSYGWNNVVKAEKEAYAQVINLIVEKEKNPSAL